MSDLFITGARNIRHALKSFVPNWLSDRIGFRVGFIALYVIALMADGLLEVLLEGIRAAWPGRGDPSGLDLVGQGRGLIRGVTWTGTTTGSEADASYAARLRAWLTLWFNAGADYILAEQVQAFLGNNLVVRVVDRAGHFTTVNADGSITRVTDTSWNWDTVGLPVRAAWWSDIWVIVYMTDGRWPTYTSFSDPAWLAQWGRYDNLVGGAGMQVPRYPVTGMRNIIASWKGAHTWVEAIIFTDNTGLFIPGSLGGTPPGTWGNWSIDVSPPGGEQSVARTYNLIGGTHIRYWVPANGG